KVISRYSLINYSDLDVSADYPMGIYNDEVIFHATRWSYMYPASSDKVNMDLYNSYATNDLRKKIWYVEETDGISYKGSYGGDFYMFCGLALDEMYLVKSESLVRLDRVAEGVLLFNKYLLRWFLLSRQIFLFSYYRGSYSENFLSPSKLKKNFGK